MMSNIIHCHAYFSTSKAFKITLTILTTIAPPKADQKSNTTNPDNNEEVNPNIMALMTNVNNPSVSILSGSVKIIRIGLIEILSNPNISEAISKSERLLNNIPVKIRLAVPREREFISQRIATFFNTFSSVNC